MLTTTIVAHEDLPGAMAILKQKLGPGRFLFATRLVDDGSPRTHKATGADAAEAQGSATAQIPERSDLLSGRGRDTW